MKFSPAKSIFLKTQKQKISFTREPRFKDNIRYRQDERRFFHFLLFHCFLISQHTWQEARSNCDCIKKVRGQRFVRTSPLVRSNFYHMSALLSSCCSGILSSPSQTLNIARCTIPLVSEASCHVFIFCVSEREVRCWNDLFRKIFCVLILRGELVSVTDDWFPQLFYFSPQQIFIFQVQSAFHSSQKNEDNADDTDFSSKFQKYQNISLCLFLCRSGYPSSQFCIAQQV